MHPYLFPWNLPSGALAGLAFLAAVGGAAVVASWMAGSKGRFSWGKFLPPFVVLALIGGVVVGKNLPFSPQPIPLHTYGLMIALGFMLAAHLAARASQRYASVDPGAFFLPNAPAVARAQKQGGAEAVGVAARQHFLDLTVWIFVGAMIGARLLFIVVNWTGPNGYGANPARIFQVWSGGLVFYGGFIGAAVAAVIYARKHRLNFRGIADIAIPGVALGHFFGRLGCMSAGCCWGKVCVDPAFFLGAKFPEGALAYKEMLADPTHQDFILQHGHTPALHPTQMYEGMGELALFFLLLQLRKGKRFHGQVFISWLVLYAILRLSIETFRGDWGRGMLLQWPEANPLLLSTSQLVGLGMITTGLVLYRLWKPTPKADAAVGAATPS